MDVAKAIALGADAAVIGTAELVALECIRCGKCESGRGCARGIASTDPELGHLILEEWAERRLVNMYLAWRKQWCELLRQYGLRSMKELVGRSDLLVHLDYLDEEERARYPQAPQPSVVI
jgi:glutamate synthase domain-containing protein 2